MCGDNGKLKKFEIKGKIIFSHLKYYVNKIYLIKTSSSRDKIHKFKYSKIILIIIIIS